MSDGFGEILILERFLLIKPYLDRIGVNSAILGLELRVLRRYAMSVVPQNDVE